MIIWHHSNPQPFRPWKVYDSSHPTPNLKLLYAARNYPLVEFCQEALNFGLLIVMSAESLRPSCVASLGDAEQPLGSPRNWKIPRFCRKKPGNSKLKVVFLALQDYTYHVFHVFITISWAKSLYFHTPLRHFWKTLWTQCDVVYPFLWQTGTSWAMFSHVYFFYIPPHCWTIPAILFHQSQHLTDQIVA